MGTPPAQPVAPAAMPPGGLRTNPRPRNGQLVGGFLALLLAITVGVFADPAAAGLTPSGLGTPGWVTALPGLGGVMGGGAGGGSGFGGSGDLAAVSYTHLDGYKRQPPGHPNRRSRCHHPHLRP